MDDPKGADGAAAGRDSPVAGLAAEDGQYGAILAIPVTVQVVLGSTSMPVASLMKLARGAVISLDQRVGDPVTIVVNGRIVARGEVVVVDEDQSRYGVSLIEIASPPGARAAG